MPFSATLGDVERDNNLLLYCEAYRRLTKSKSVALQRHSRRQVCCPVR